MSLGLSVVGEEVKFDAYGCGCVVNGEVHDFAYNIIL